MSIGLFQILFIALVILVLFGRGRIGEAMGDFGKGVKRFREGMADDEPAPARLEAAEAATDPAADKTVG